MNRKLEMGSWRADSLNSESEAVMPQSLWPQGPQTPGKPGAATDSTAALVG